MTANKRYYCYCCDNELQNIYEIEEGICDFCLENENNIEVLFSGEEEIVQKIVETIHKLKLKINKINNDFH